MSAFLMRSRADDPSSEVDVSVEGDGKTVWVHVNGACLARFGKLFYEVCSPTEPGRMLAHGRSSAAAWLDFKSKVLEVFDCEIGDTLTPIRYAEELGLTPAQVTGSTLFLLSVERLVSFGDPFEEDVWGRGRVTRQHVLDCIERGDLASNFVDMPFRDLEPRGWDARRIAYFVVHPDDWPISIEFVSPDGDFNIEDGWHRLAAALYRGDENILAVLAGFVDGYDATFPDRIPVEVPETCDRLRTQETAVLGSTLAP